MLNMFSKSLLGRWCRPIARRFGPKSLETGLGGWKWSSTLAQQIGATSGLEGADVVNGKMELSWADGKKHQFDLCWLRDNCPCPKCLSDSGQKTSRDIVPESLTVKSVQVDPETQQLKIVWNDHEGKFATYSGTWLRKFGYTDVGLTKHDHKILGSDHERLPTMEYEALMAGEEGVHKWMSLINKCGYCVIKNSPLEEQTVKKVANLVGPVSHTIYGDTFDVVAVPDPINIAYSDEELEPHMDLAYFESPPGIQMLHCIRFDRAVKGGQSTLIDGHAVAEEFQERHPELFEILSTVPATFQKDHLKRANPIKMFYQRPHIAVNYLKEVVAVFWSPPFEGPLRVKAELVEPYYRAYHEFHNLLLSKEMWQKYGVEFRLHEGDLFVFNNRRMLHGRRRFTSHDGARHLQGCYLDVDTYLNKYRILDSKYNPDAHLATLSAVNETRFGTSNHT